MTANRADSTTVYVVITADSGIIEGATLFRDGSQADEYAREQWREATGGDEPDGESLTGTHNDDFDVWVFQEELDAEAPNSPNVDTLADVTTVRRIR